MSGNMEYSFCPECGALMSGDVCATCGAVIKEQALFEDFNTSSVYTTGNLNAGAEVTRAAAPRKKASIPVIVWILGGVIGLLLLLMIVVIVVAVIFIVFASNSVQKTTVSQVTSSSQTSIVASEEETEEYEEYEEYEEDSSLADSAVTTVTKLQGKKMVDLSGIDVEGYFDNTDAFFEDEVGMPLENHITYYSLFPYEHVNVPREEMIDMYYNIWGESFDYSCGYSVEGHCINYYNVIDAVSYNAYVGYYQLIGDHIPNLDDLNKQMYEQAVNPLIAQLEGLTQYTPSQEMSIYVEPFITYNDEYKMSVIYVVTVYCDAYLQEAFYLVCQNIDLQEGRMLSASDLLQLDDSFADEFRERSYKQNGSYVEALETLSNHELVDYLMDDETNILFFSPCGLELGLNYIQDVSYWGWVTVTIREMSDYLKDDTYDFIKNAKSTWAAPNGENYDLNEALQEYYDRINKKYGYDEDFYTDIPEEDDPFVLPDNQGETGDL